jgi:hypothetical protein
MPRSSIAQEVVQAFLRRLETEQKISAPLIGDLRDAAEREALGDVATIRAMGPKLRGEDA